MWVGQFAGMTGAPGRSPPDVLVVLVVVWAGLELVLVEAECDDDLVVVVVVVWSPPTFSIWVEVETVDEVVDERDAQRPAAAARFFLPSSDRSRDGAKPSCFVALI